NANLIIVEILPFYPTFGMAYVIKTNIQTQPNIIQPMFTSISDSIPTLHEFFEKLNEAYNNSNDDYLKLEAAFAREKLTVNAIKDLSDEYLRELG
ncbi:34680_t:CDS:1, partial [Racocetra persica]